MTFQVWLERSMEVPSGIRQKAFIVVLGAFSGRRNRSHVLVGQFVLSEQTNGIRQVPLRYRPVEQLAMTTMY